MGLKNFLILILIILLLCSNFADPSNILIDLSSHATQLNPFVGNRDFTLIAFLIALKPNELEKNANVTV